eukprot:1265517-Amphidinium_carterae.2
MSGRVAGCPTHVVGSANHRESRGNMPCSPRVFAWVLAALRLDSDGSDRVAKLTDELDSQSRELASLREAKTAVESQ